MIGSTYLGLMTGEGHIPVANAHYGSAAPILG